MQQQDVERGWPPNQHRVHEELPIVPRSDAVRSAWVKFRLAHGTRPLVGALIVGGATLALASNIGALELAIGALAAYITYRMLRYGLDLKQALVETVEIEELVRREI